MFCFRIIASGVRRLSRSFYGGSGENLHPHRRTGSFAELSGGTGSPGSLRHFHNSGNGSQTTIPGGREAIHMSRKRAPLKFGQTQSDSDLQAMEQEQQKQQSDSLTVKNNVTTTTIEESTTNSTSSSTLDNSASTSSNSTGQTSVPISKKLSRITLRKLKIW